mmetsp:Transcript_20576/g.63806  ORF Transcript_20576/g.63806 Transcript_20576/m.63806 type:complete len:249 (-) Transcript_20576:2031-2777(-)
MSGTEERKSCIASFNSLVSNSNSASLKQTGRSSSSVRSLYSNSYSLRSSYSSSPSSSTASSPCRRRRRAAAAPSLAHDARGEALDAPLSSRVQRRTYCPKVCRIADISWPICGYDTRYLRVSASTVAHARLRDPTPSSRARHLLPVALYGAFRPFGAQSASPPLSYAMVRCSSPAPGTLTRLNAEICPPAVSNTGSGINMCRRAAISGPSIRRAGELCPHGSPVASVALASAPTPTLETEPKSELMPA